MTDDLLFAKRAKQRLQRRLFLKAAAVGLSAPLAVQLMKSAVAAPTGVPKRFMLFYMPHGIAPEHCNPVGSGTNFGLTETGVSSFSGLEPFKSQVNIYQGMKYLDGETHSSVSSFLSNTTLQGDTTSPRTTIEHYIGNELACPTLALGAVPNRGFGLDKDSMVMWDQQAVSPQANPLVAYDQVFGSFGGGGDDAAAVTEEELRQSMLTLTEGRVAALRGELASLSGEQSRLQVHLDSLARLKASGSAGQNSCTGAPVLESVEALRAQFGSDTSDWFMVQDNFEAVMTAQMEIAAAAMICNVRPVTALQNLYTVAEVPFGFTGYGTEGAHHGELSHIGPQADNLTVREPFAQAQRWFVDKLATHVLEKLNVDDPAAPGSTVLDNSIVLLASEIGEGAWHGTETRQIWFGSTPMFGYLPLITIGGGGGALKTGQLLNFHDGVTGDSSGNGDRVAGDLWLTLAQAMGVATSEFNGATNPIVEALA